VIYQKHNKVNGEHYVNVTGETVCHKLRCRSDGKRRLIILPDYTKCGTGAGMLRNDSVVRDILGMSITVHDIGHHIETAICMHCSTRHEGHTFF